MEFYITLEVNLFELYYRYEITLSHDGKLAWSERWLHGNFMKCKRLLMSRASLGPLFGTKLVGWKKIQNMLVILFSSPYCKRTRGRVDDAIHLLSRSKEKVLHQVFM